MRFGRGRKLEGPRWGRIAVFVGAPATALLLVACFILVAWWQLPGGRALHQMVTDGPYCATVVDRSGSAVLAYHCAPAAVRYLSIDSVPDQLVSDLEFFEQRSFPWNPVGVSPAGIVRAFRGMGGGSTITQQLARSVLDFPDRTLYRKAIEIVMAVKLETIAGLSKREILEAYINRSRFGGGREPGLSYAAERYFGKRPMQLSRAEWLLLISFLPRPSRANLARQAERELVYQARVTQLHWAGRVDDSTWSRLRQVPTFALRSEGRDYAGLYLARVTHAADSIARVRGISLNGARIETTLDRSANDAVGRSLATGVCCGVLTASFVFLDPESEVEVYTTGHPTYGGDLDVIASPASIPASQFKLLSYALLVDRLLRERWTPGDVLRLPIPSSFTLSVRHTIRDPEYPASISLMDAIVRSRNAAAYAVTNQFQSPASVAAFVRRLGINVPALPSIAVGSVGVPQIDLAAAYNALLVRNGYYLAPVFIRRVTRLQDDSIVYDAKWSDVQPPTPVISEQASELLRGLVRQVVNRNDGTGHALVAGFPGASTENIGAKTGSSSGSLWAFRGITGIAGQSGTFSLLLQGPHLAAAGTLAAPLAGRLLQAMTPAASRRTSPTP